MLNKVSLIRSVVGRVCLPGTVFNGRLRHFPAITLMLVLFSSLLFLFDGSVGFQLLSPVQISSCKSQNQRLRGSDICCNRDIVLVAGTDNFVDIRLFRIDHRRIVKENYHIHIAAFNHLGKLFVSAYASRQKLVYMKVRHLFNPPSGGSGGVHLMFHEDSLVCNTEILDQTLLAVVCYDSNIHYCKPPLLLFLLPCTAIITNLFSIRNSFCEFFTQFLYFFLPFHFSFFFYFLRFSGKNTESGSLFLYTTFLNER